MGVYLAPVTCARCGCAFHCEMSGPVGRAKVDCIGCDREITFTWDLRPGWTYRRPTPPPVFGGLSRADRA